MLEFVQNVCCVVSFSEYPRYVTKQFEGGAPVILEFGEIRSTTLLPLLPGSFWPGVVAPDRVLSMGRIKLKCVLEIEMFWHLTMCKQKKMNLCSTEYFEVKLFRCIKMDLANAKTKTDQTKLNQTKPNHSSFLYRWNPMNWRNLQTTVLPRDFCKYSYSDSTDYLTQKAFLISLWIFSTSSRIRLTNMAL